MNIGPSTLALVQDLTVELSRAANLVCDRIRENHQSSLAPQGKEGIVSSTDKEWVPMGVTSNFGSVTDPKSGQEFLILSSRTI